MQKRVILKKTKWEVGVLELQQLKYFKAVADSGKIADAAKSLFISPPALSATISRLERELDVKLFERSNNRIALNKHGKLMLGYVNQILSLLSSMENELKKSKKQEQEQIRVAVTYSNLWVGLICAFSLEHPEITLSYTTLKLSQLQNRSELGRYQFILAEESDLPSDREMDSVPLISGDRPVLAVHPEHPLAKKQSVSIREVEHETLVLPVYDQSLHRITCQLLDDAGIPHTSSMECSYMVRRSMVMNNHAVSFSTVNSSKYEESSFCYIPIEDSERSWTHRLFSVTERELLPQEELFRDFAIRYFAGQNQSGTV